jgi:prephenate dehydrogenase
LAHRFKQITICGVGLIGGSLALAARRAGIVGRIVGYGRSQANLNIALERGIVDYITRDPLEAAAGAELVVLATPIRSMKPTLTSMSSALPDNAVITDVGSVKASVIESIEPILGAGMALVAAHPIAGRETTGAAAANVDLFRNARVIITPSERSTSPALDAVEALWRATGARVERMCAATHDALLARASHLPQLLSTALACALEGEVVDGRWAAAYGAGGLRDMTRLAASSAEVWVDICASNRGAIAKALAAMRTALDEIGRLLESGDEAGLREMFERGARMRKRLVDENRQWQSE